MATSRDKFLGKVKTSIAAYESCLRSGINHPYPYALMSELRDYLEDEK